MDELTKEQIEHWRKALMSILGPYALIMPVEEIQHIRDIAQKKAGLLVLKNKNTGTLKFIKIPFNPFVVEKLKRKARDIKKILAAPKSVQARWVSKNRINNGECAECQFRGSCKPVVKEMEKIK